MVVDISSRSGLTKDPTTDSSRVVLLSTEKTSREPVGVLAAVTKKRWGFINIVLKARSARMTGLSTSTH